jgi:hypothetical protein
MSQLTHFSDASPRHGQWVKFKLPEAETAELLKHDAHVTADGHLVGVFQRGGKDLLGNSHPVRIEPVDKAGAKVRYLSEDKNSVMVASVNPAHAIDLHPLTDRNEVPVTRLATMDEKWTPLP